MRILDLLPDLLLVLLIKDKVVEWLDEELDDTLEDMDSLELIDSFSSLMLLLFELVMRFMLLLAESMLAESETVCWWLVLLADFLETVSWLMEACFLERIMYLDRLVESDEEDEDETVETDDLFSSGGWVSLTSFFMRAVVKSSEKSSS